MTIAPHPVETLVFITLGTLTVSTMMGISATGLAIQLCTQRCVEGQKF